MPRNIRATIQEVIVRRIVEEGDRSPTAQEMQDRALLAILKGQRDAQGGITREWREYMTFLLEGPGGVAAPADSDDLARLVPNDNEADAARQKDRAYLVGNGMCGTGTGRNILINGSPTAALDAD